MVGKLYFAHGRGEYGTTREQYMLDLLKVTFPQSEIINPGSEGFQLWMAPQVDRFQSASEYIKPFYDIIDGCYILVFMPYLNGKVGVGTFLETRHAEAMGIFVLVWDGVEFVRDYRLDECHTHDGKKDYANNWAELTLGETYAEGEVERNTDAIKVKAGRNQAKAESRRVKQNWDFMVNTDD